MQPVKRTRVPEWRRPAGYISVAELAAKLDEPYWRVWDKLQRHLVPYLKQEGIRWIHREHARRFAKEVFGKEVHF